MWKRGEDHAGYTRSWWLKSGQGVNLFHTWLSYRAYLSFPGGRWDFLSPQKSPVLSIILSFWQLSQLFSCFIFPCSVKVQHRQQTWRSCCMPQSFLPFVSLTAFHVEFLPFVPVTIWCTVWSIFQIKRQRLRETRSFLITKKMLLFI